MSDSHSTFGGGEFSGEDYTVDISPVEVDMEVLERFVRRELIHDLVEWSERDLIFLLYHKNSNPRPLPVLTLVQWIAPFRVLRSKRAYTGCDRGFILGFIDKLINLLVNIRSRGHLQKEAAAYIRTTLKWYRDKKVGYTDERRPVQANGKTTGDRWKKKTRDMTYKPGYRRSK